MGDADTPRRDFSIPLPVLVKQGGEEARIEYATNAAPTGLCLQFRSAPEEGAILDLSFEVPPEGPEVRCRGRVVWSELQDGTGRLCEAGVELLELTPEASAALDAFARQPIDRRR